MSSLVVAEVDETGLKRATLNTVAAAKQLGAPISVLIAGEDCGAAAASAARIDGVATVLVADDARYAHALAEPVSVLVARVAKDFSHVLAPATAFGKSVLPRVAALLDVGQISDIAAVAAADEFVRPIYAGSAMATVRSLDPIKVLTVRVSAFDAAASDGGSGEIRAIEPAETFAGSLWVGQQLTKSDRPDLTSASVVIAGGRGMQDREHFGLLEALADRLGAAIGASRAAVDAGWVSNDCQVGQTGKVVAPDLYIAVGISGAIQHLAGMKDSKVIVAINKDEEAPIFQIADYGLVADLFQAVPEFAKALETLS